MADYEFTDGFDKYGRPGSTGVAGRVTSGEWTSYNANNATSMSIVAGLSATGQALRLTCDGASGELIKTVPGNYREFVGGATFHFNSFAATQLLHSFWDIGTLQMSLTVETDGTIGFRRGGTTFATGSTLVAHSAESVTSGSTHVIEWSVTIDNSSGVVKVWIDGVLTTLNLTSQDTQTSANNYANRVGFAPPFSNGATIDADHLYEFFWLTPAGRTPLLTNPVIETQFPNADVQKQWSFGAAVLGEAYTDGTAITGSANKLFLRPFTPDAGGTIQSVAMIPLTTSAGAKFKAVIYADSAGAPGSLLSSGTEVVGSTSGTALVGALTTPQTLTAGTKVWIGFITDAAVNMSRVDSGTLGYTASNTYASGAPGTAPTMTASQTSYMFYGIVTGVTTAWQQVDNNPPLGDLSFNYSATVGQEDLLGFPGLVNNPQTIHLMAVKTNVARTDSGARTIDLRTKSSSVTSSGSITGISPATAYGWVASYFDVDPNTSAAWAATALNSASSGLKIAS